MRLTITPQDALRGKVCDPDQWYPVEITKVEEKEASTDQSMNLNLEAKIIGGKFKDVPLRRTFNEKAPGFLVNFIKALGGSVSESENTVVDLGENLIGRQMQWFVKNSMYNSQMKNDVADFRAI
jgi:hypothetical protein